MSVHLHWEQGCANGTDCHPGHPPRPARHAELCANCYRGATPAVRALCDWMDAHAPRATIDTLISDCDMLVSRTEPVDTNAVAQCVALEAMYDAPAYRRAA